MRRLIVALPVSFFSMVLGIIGLGTDWRVAATLWHLPAWIGEVILLTGALLWIYLIGTYVAKWFIHRADALAEVNHPILCCFIGLVPASGVLVGVAASRYVPAAAETLCLLGAVGTVAFAVWRQGGLWRGGRDVTTLTPALYLPTAAGSFIVATAAGTLGWAGWGQLFLGTGVLAWLALESVILHRLLTAQPLAPSLRPLLGIQLAPPVVALVAYLSVREGPPDLLAHLLLGYGLLQALTLLRLAPWIREQPFNAGYWAFSFGVTALAAGAERMVLAGGTGPERLLAPVLFVFANVVVGGIAVGTVVRLSQGKLLTTPATVGAR